MRPRGEGGTPLFVVERTAYLPGVPVRSPSHRYWGGLLGFPTLPHLVLQSRFGTCAVQFGPHTDSAVRGMRVRGIEAPVCCSSSQRQNSSQAIKPAMSSLALYSPFMTVSFFPEGRCPVSQR